MTVKKGLDVDRPQESGEVGDAGVGVWRSAEGLRVQISVNRVGAQPHAGTGAPPAAGHAGPARDRIGPAC